MAHNHAQRHADSHPNYSFRNGSNRQHRASAKGALLLIGGHEDQKGDRVILQELARRAKKGKLVVATLASEEPGAQWQEYEQTFRELGVQRIEQLDVRRRKELLDNPRLDLLEDASVVFFAGGDQLKITTKLGGTPLSEGIKELYRRGATIAGTSSGASVLSDVMLVAGAGKESPETGGALRLGPGLGLLPGVIIDQHFAERGRIGRLLGVVAQNPRLLGIGIDENTAVLFERDEDVTVLGSGAVSIVDGREVTYTNVAEEGKQTISVFGVRLHVLSPADRFHLRTRKPQSAPKETGEREIPSRARTDEKSCT
jgi:cyanophycinase